MRDFVLSYFILFYPVWLLPLGGLLFSEQDPVYLEEREVAAARRSEGAGTVVGIYCMCEESIFIKKKKLESFL